MIIEKARELGLELSESPEFKEMLASRSLVDANEEISAMIAAYNEKQTTIVSMLEEADADTEAIQGLSAEMDRIQSELMATPVFLRAIEAQNAFEQLMQQVNHTIGVCIGAPEEDEAESSCTGSCATCGGCKH